MDKKYAIKAHWNKCDFRGSSKAGALSMLQCQCQSSILMRKRHHLVELGFTFITILAVYTGLRHSEISK